MKRIKYLTGKSYEQVFLDFFRNEDRGSNVMTTARIKPFCKKYNVNIGYYDNIRVYPRFVAERNKPLYLYKNHFCFIWKSEGVSFRKAIQEFEKKIQSL